MARKQKKVNKLCGLLITLLMLTACSQHAEHGDVLTQKAIPKDKIPVTVSVKYAIYLNEFEKAAQARFPELELIQVGNYTSNFSEEYAQQLANDDLADIVITWPLDQAAKNCEDRLIDLSGMEFTSRYNLSALNVVSQNGKLFYLPGPTPVRGIVYNKTMFEENGWELPTDFEGFLALCKQIEACGIRSLQLSFWNEEVLRYAFIGFGYTESFSSPSANQKMQEYSIGKGSIRNFAQPAFDTFEAMINANIFRPEDLMVRYPTREKMMFNRECAMISDELAIIELAKKSGCTDEFAIMPFYSPKSENGWGHLAPIQYIGLNKKLTQPENKEKYDLVLRVMDFISTPEGQLALASNNASHISSLTNKSLLTLAPELKPMQEAIAQGCYAIFPSFSKNDKALSEALAAMLKGELSKAEAIRALDNANRNPKPKQRSEVIGYAESNFSLAQTGAYVTDTIRAQANADIALFLDNGKDGAFSARGISAKLYEGEIRETDITQRILPTLQHGEAGYLNIVSITGKNLYNVLEYSLPDGNWFYYASGLKIKFDPLGEKGKRIIKLTDEQNNDIAADKLYTVAIMEGTVDEQWIQACEATELLIKDIIIEDIKLKKTISPVSDGRFTVKAASKR